MGVNSLWEILGPAARTVRLEALSRKRLAVDASIWIYQFLKAVRDSQGNALQASHIVGFFRRICKLLYFGILPIFVFDGGAPALKRETINKRRERREGKQENATETAKRLLAIHVQRQAKGQKENKSLVKENKDNIVYLEDLPNQLPGETRPQNTDQSATKKRFFPTDEYHLPQIKKIRVSEEDERLMTEEEFNELTAHSFDIVDGIDINTVDPKSPEFASLPMATQYMILSHLRLKSRLRMGFSKDQLENIFTNSLEFSKFQIQQVQKRNYFTQKLMDISGMGKEGNATRRIAGDKDRHYQLIRSDNGWTLALGEGEGSSNNPIALDDQNIDLDVGNPARYLAENGPRSFGSLPKHGEGERKLPPADNDSSDTDDFEDVDLNGNQQETAEEKDFQRAVIESIYEQYNDTEDIDLNELKAMDQKMVKSGQASDSDLKKAIELSKKDYFSLKKGENKMFANSNAPSLDFSSSLLFGGIKRIPDAPNVTENSSITVNASEKDGSNKANNIPTTEEKEHAKTSKNEMPAVVEAIEWSGADTDEEDTSKQLPKGSRAQMPEWFNDKIDEVSYKYASLSKPTSQKQEQKPSPEAEVGLISWEDAKNYLEEVDAEDNDHSPNEEIEEVEDVQEAELAPKSEEIVQETNTDEELRAKDDGLAENAGHFPAESSDIKNEAPKEVKENILDYVFVDDEEEMMNEQLASEQMDHEDLKREIRSTQEIPLSSASTHITNEQLLQEKLHKAKRDAEEVTQTMINDVQELLRRFGIPFITAPMEAEAQCAELLNLGLVDGIITDDGDCFLFGGDRIYKNMFNQKQYVECYFRGDLQSKLGLSQHRLIELGLLLGSDYTEGIKGIGPVLAMEILAEFGDLKEFKRWFDVNSQTTNSDTSTSLKKTLMNRIKNGKLYLPLAFPDQVVFDAYTMPQVDKSEEQFKWGVPDLDQIRSYLMYNVGWSQERVDEVMIPLIRDMNRKRREGTQSTIGEFFPTSFTESRKELAIGKRLKAAANKLNRRK